MTPNRSVSVAPSLLFLLTLVPLSAGDAQAHPDDDPQPTLQQRIDAAVATARSAPLCTAIQPFYWEIGDSSTALVTGSVGGNRFTATTQLDIASSSKWMFAAYLVQRSSGHPTDAEVKALTMRTGYVNINYGACLRYSPLRQRTETVEECFQSGGNDTYTAADDGLFYYGNVHFQAYGAQDPRLAAKNNATLQAELASQLGQDVSFRYDQPLISAGIKTSASDYAVFLRKLLGGTLYMHDLLGSYAVCTQPSTCATAAYTPTPPGESWHYSLGHWVEDDPNVGDGAFSSAGAYGFYPWIDASKRWYGVLSRYSTSDSAYNDSMTCGRLIRKAWESGVAQ